VPAPKAKSALECVEIVSQARAGRKFREQSGITSPEHNIVSLHRILELLDDLIYLTAPFPFPLPVQAGLPQIIFIGPAILIRQVAQFHRLQRIINDQR